LLIGRVWVASGGGGDKVAAWALEIVPHSGTLSPPTHPHLIRIQHCCSSRAKFLHTLHLHFAFLVAGIEKTRSGAKEEITASYLRGRNWPRARFCVKKIRMHAGGGAQLSGGCVGLQQQQKQQHAQSIRCTSMCELAAAAAAGALSAARARPFVPGLSKCVARAGHEPPACRATRADQPADAPQRKVHRSSPR
jgi:hypothetical protein